MNIGEKSKQVSNFVDWAGFEGLRLNNEDLYSKERTEYEVLEIMRNGW